MIFVARHLVPLSHLVGCDFFIFFWLGLAWFRSVLAQLKSSLVFSVCLFRFVVFSFFILFVRAVVTDVTNNAVCDGLLLFYFFFPLAVCNDI